MKKRIVTLLLALCLVCALLPGTALATGWTEVDSASALAQALADTPARAMARGAQKTEPVRILLLGDTLPDDCGAQRVLHYAAAQEFILEYASRDAAQAALDTLTTVYGVTSCWLDTPEQGARVLEDGTGAAPLAVSTWGASYMNLTAYQSDAQALKHVNAGSVRVAIIDSGADLTLPELAARSVDSYDFVNNTAEVIDVQAGSAAGHGTRVASILDALLPECAEFMVLRVFDEAGSASRIRVRTALQYAVEQGADIINLSLGWEDADDTFTFLDGVLQTARAKGVTVVCAAGNEHQDVENCYPANSAATIAVSSVNKLLNYEVYSNYGALIDFCAPGSGIYATTPGGGTASCTGTSFSAPHITAAAAELKLFEPAATPERIYNLLKGCAKDLGVTGKDNIYGWGIPILPGQPSSLVSHMWDAGRVTSPATATADGEREFACTVCGATKTEPIPATGETTDSGFVDVDAGQYYAVPVAWAAENGVTTGTDTTHFSPNAICTRAQVVTFLWRTAGSPEPKQSATAFTDVPRSAYYYKAVLWAVEQGVTLGTSDTTFAPNDTCTRAHVVTFLWRFRGEPARDGGTPFTDVSEHAYYFDAVRWAVASAVTNGMTATTFVPNGGCTRAHVVTFLYRSVNGAAG